MRLIGKLDRESLARRFSTYLDQIKISHHIEPEINRDWGSNAYGTPEYLIWIEEEDRFDTASEALTAFQANPDAERFEAKSPLIEPAPAINEQPKPNARRLTYFLIGLCSLLFFANEALTKNYGEELNILYLSPVNSELLYDYPKRFELLNQLLATWGIEGIKDPSSLPPEGNFLLQEFINSPAFQGFYPHIVATLQGKEPPPPAPLFEKIRQGEIWRTFTPALLHSDLFHLLFNMIWLLILGRQIEERIGSLRMLLFVLITAIVSNTAQYLMGGSAFMGFSGVIAAMLTFIWMRTKRAPWEGYQLDKATFAFVSIYILAFFSLQLGAFFFEILFSEPFSFGMANTAHLAGALMGYLLSRGRFFMWRHS